MIAFLAVMMNLIAGDSLVSIHVIPAIAGGAIVFLAGKITGEFGVGLSVSNTDRVAIPNALQLRLSDGNIREERRLQTTNGV